MQYTAGRIHMRYLNLLSTIFHNKYECTAKYAEAPNVNVWKKK